MKNDNSQTVKATKPEIKLPKLLFQNQILSVMDLDPLKAIETLVRTPEELSMAVDCLVSKSMHSEPSQIEALILWIIEESYTDNAAEKVIRWYGLCDNNSPHRPSRKDYEYMRAFRFLLQDGAGDIRINQVLFGLHCRPWYGNIINDMVRKYPWLYWCHKRYQDRVAEALDEFAKRDHSKPYGDRDWQGVERCIRRVVDAEDWKHCNLVNTICRLHHEGKMSINKNEGEGKDPFTPGRIKAFLEDAVGFLARQRNTDSASNSNAQTFGTALRSRGDLDGVVSIEIVCPYEIIIPKEDFGPSRFSVKITDDKVGELEKLSVVLSPVSLKLEIDGGYFPAIDGENERTAVLYSAPEEFGLYEFYFIPFEGRGRLTLTLSYDGRGETGKKDSSFSTVVRYFFEAKAIDTEVRPQ